MPNTDITNVTMAAFDTVTAYSPTAATATDANATETFDLVLTKKPSKAILMFYNANSHGTYTVSIAAGDCWAGAASATLSIPQNTTKAVQINTSKYMNSDGTIAITLTPASGKILLTNHAATIGCIELL